MDRPGVPPCDLDRPARPREAHRVRPADRGQLHRPQAGQVGRRAGVLGRRAAPDARAAIATPALGFIPLRRRRTTNGPEASSPIASGRALSGPSCQSGGQPPMPSRSNAHPSGSVTSSNRRPLSGHVAGEAQRVPAERVLAAERQLGHVVHLRVEQVRARLAPVEVRQRAHLHQRRHVRRAAGASAPARRARGASRPTCTRRRRFFTGTGSSSSGMPPERVLRFLLHIEPPFEACRRPRVITSGSTCL